MLDLITIEGFERSGKDSLLLSIKNSHLNEFFYHQPASESAGVSYRDTERFQEILRKYFQRMVDDLKSIRKSSSRVILTRFLISDNIYSDMFGRDHILENMIVKENCFQIHPFVILWKNYGEYLKRVKSSDSQIEYSEEEFEIIQKKFEENCKKYHGKCIFISNDTTRQDILKSFETFFEGLN